VRARPLKLRTIAAAWLAAHRPAMVIEVADARGSVPRDPGTRMLVARDAVEGTIGGGHLELQAIAQARERFGQTFEARIALGPTLGQCCGGALVLRHAPLDAAALARWPDDPPLFTLDLYGAGHVGRAIVRVLATLDCRVRWIDERESEFPAGPDAPHIERVCAEPVDAEVTAAPHGSCFLVLTHSHDLDLALAHAILKRDDFAWFGLIGSETKRARFEHRLAERGIPGDRLARMVCPIGLPGITGKQPEVIAVAVVAQLLQAASAPDCQRQLALHNASHPS
jgi:xanthine dehydrogenase accessory factor